MNDYVVTIGLEVHAQLNTRTKMFCGCPVVFGAEPNRFVCPVCLGLPGALPVVNAVAVEKTIRAGLLLGCEVSGVTHWDRKSYFYPDMPKNYQISQFDRPLCVGGRVRLYEWAYPRDGQGSIVRPGFAVELTRIHLEEDVGKCVHVGGVTLLDFNRAGAALMEVVSEPVIGSAEEAVAFVSSLRQVLVYGGVCDGDMEKGHVRCDVNVSVRPVGQVELGAKVELKNLNSLSAIRRAIVYETARQAGDLRRGVVQVQCTRRWDDDAGVTQLMRRKEDAHDYRYFPDPDLLPFDTGVLRAEVAGGLPELPDVRLARFVEGYGVGVSDAGVLMGDRVLADFFEEAARLARSPRRVANWVIHELLGTLNELGIGVVDCPISARQVAELTDCVESGQVTHGQAREVYGVLLVSGGEVSGIIKERGFEVVSDVGWLEGLVDEVLGSDAGVLAGIRAGDVRKVNWVVGQVMKLGKGKANPQLVQELLRARVGLE